MKEVRELLQSGEKEKAAELAGRYFVGEITPTEAGDQFGDFGGNQPFGSLCVTVDGLPAESGFGKGDGKSRVRYGRDVFSEYLFCFLSGSYVRI